MIINNNGRVAIDVNSSFVAKRKSDSEIEIKSGAIIGPSGQPISLSPLSQIRENSEESLYLNFVSNSINGSVTGCHLIKKEEFQFQDESFHYPVLIRKSKSNEGINSDVVHYQPDYGGLNIQIIEELVDDPNRFIIKISNFDNFYNTGDRKLYIESYVTKGGGIKILGSTKTLNEGAYEYGSLELINNLDQDKTNSETTSYFVPLASIDTDRIDFTVLY